MRTLIVGGHTRNIGKTALVVDILRAFPEAGWTAVKITQYAHGVCAVNGENCDCAPSDHSAAVDEEQDRSKRTDTSRFLAAGASRAFWVRTKQGRLAEALPLLRKALPSAGNVILESNSVLYFLRPDLYLVVLDPRQSDFKDSARQFLDRADAFVLRSPLECGAWAGSSEVPSGVSPRLLEGSPCFLQPLGGALPEPLLALIASRFFSRSSKLPTPSSHLSS
jgi:hypothetical protein